MAMTPRENLLTAFRHEKPAWIPVIGHCDPYNQPNREGMDPDLAGKLGTVEWGDGSSGVFSRYLGLDVMDFFMPPIEIKRHKVVVEERDTAEGRVKTYKTPRGVLREVHKQVRDDGTSYCLEHLVKGVEDLPILASVFEDEEIVLKPGAADWVRQRKAEVGDQGLARSYMLGTPLGMLVRLYAEVDTIAYLWADHREELRRLLAVMEENHLQWYRLAATLDYDIVYGTDDTSTTTISPAMFQEFCLGYTDRVADAVHAHGVLYAHHSCGLIHNLLDLYRQTRMDAVDALSVKPIGDIVSLADAKARLGPRITMIASLVQMFISIEDRAETADSIARMFREVAPGDNIVFGLAADPTKNMEQTGFVARECRKHQRMYDSRKLAA